MLEQSRQLWYAIDERQGLEDCLAGQGVADVIAAVILESLDRKLVGSNNQVPNDCFQILDLSGIEELQQLLQDVGAHIVNHNASVGYFAGFQHLAENWRTRCEHRLMSLESDSVVRRDAQIGEQFLIIQLLEVRHQQSELLACWLLRNFNRLVLEQRNLRIKRNRLECCSIDIKILHLDGQSQNVVGHQVRSLEHKSLLFDEVIDHEIFLEALQTTKTSIDRTLVNDLAGC